MLLSGIVLLFLVERTLIATSNPNYAPSVILLGAFLVPVTFVTYLYDRLPSWDVSLPALAVCFLWGGVLGTVVAGTLEYDVARALGFLPKLAIGLIEESAKLIVPLGFYFLGRYRSEAAGIILGVTTAAGFAALETMGYGFVSLLGSKGNTWASSTRCSWCAASARLPGICRGPGWCAPSCGGKGLRQATLP
jgi:RsiW-degrading membrane proteinase PrsW (M82 family)